MPPCRNGVAKLPPEAPPPMKILEADVAPAVVLHEPRALAASESRAFCARARAFAAAVFV